MASILTQQQKLTLTLIAQTSLASAFYFSGGTALAHYYLQHRKSEDLDFFSEQEFDPTAVSVSIKSLKQKLGYISVDYQNSFNRNLFFLAFPDEYVLKLEFTYYPFPHIQQPLQKDGLLVDAPIDIATNKLFTISQKPRGRDYFDLYHLSRKYKYSIEELRMKAKLKFDWHIDPLQLASKLFEVDKHLDDPIVLKEINSGDLISFFQNEAKSMSKEILE